MGSRAPEDIVHPQTGEVLIKKNRKLGKQAIKRLQDAGIATLPMKSSEMIGHVLAQDVIDFNTGEIVAECNDTITEKMLADLLNHNITQLELLHLEGQDVSPSFRNTLLMDKVNTREDALHRNLSPPAAQQSPNA